MEPEKVDFVWLLARYVEQGTRTSYLKLKLRLLLKEPSGTVHCGYNKSSYCSSLQWENPTYLFGLSFEFSF